MSPLFYQLLSLFMCGQICLLRLVTVFQIDKNVIFTRDVKQHIYLHANVNSVAQNPRG